MIGKFLIITGVVGAAIAAVVITKKPSSSAPVPPTPTPEPTPGKFTLRLYIQLPDEPLRESGAGGAIVAVPMKYSYSSGDLVQLYANVPGLSFNGWYVDGQFYDAHSMTNILVLSSHDIVAHFI